MFVILSQKTQVKKGGKAKKIQLKYTIDCRIPVEDEIMDAGAFVSCLGFCYCHDGFMDNLMDSDYTHMETVCTRLLSFNTSDLNMSCISGRVITSHLYLVALLLSCRRVRCNIIYRIHSNIITAPP